jgi:quercetin dioxygenase-like cupin family protein
VLVWFGKSTLLLPALDSLQSWVYDAARRLELSLREVDMKISSAIFATALALGSIAAYAQDDHTMIQPDQVKWAPAPAALPAGAQAAVIYGDPSKEGLFALRLKFPDGYKIAPHTHPTFEAVTVLSGTFKLGMGETADEAKAQALPAGSFFAFPPGSAHYASAEGETIVQITTVGPWGLTYVNPKDDPRQSQ